MNDKILRVLGKSCIVKDSKKNIVKLHKGQHYEIVDLRGYTYVFKFLKMEIINPYIFINGIEVMYKVPISFASFRNYNFNRICSINSIKK